MRYFKQHSSIQNNLFFAQDIFQETRRHIVAEWQHIVYSEFLPIILGTELITQFDLESKPSLYDPRVNPSIFTEFSTAAYRFGHSMIQNQVNCSFSQAILLLKICTKQ